MTEPALTSESRKKLLIAAAGVVFGIAIWLILRAFAAGLDPRGAISMGILAWAVVWWIAGILPEFCTAFIMVLAFYLFADVEFSISMNFFSTGTWWILVGAFSMGAGMKACGLLRRMALAILRAFPKTYRAQIIGLFATGNILGPLVPSLSAKLAIFEPVALNMGESLGYEHRGRQQAGLFMATFVGARNVCPAVVSASLIGYALWGVFPAETVAEFGMVHWFVCALPWFIPSTILCLLALIWVYRPRKGEERVIAADEWATILASPGPLSRQERWMVLITVITVGLWVTEGLHGIPSYVVLMGTVAAMFAAKVLDKQSFRSGIGWDSLIFMGIIFGMASVFNDVGVSTWIVAACAPVFSGLVHTPYLLLLTIGLVTVALRFVIVSEVAYINIIMVFLVPLALSSGVNPWVIGMAIACTISPWIMPYQNVCYLAGYYAVDGQMVTHKDAARFSFIYLAICFASLMIATPFWQMMGFFG